jgi:hypothetical protein
MIVSELISLLQKMPHDSEVFRLDMESADGTAGITDVHLEKAVRDNGYLRPIDSIQESFYRSKPHPVDIVEIVVIGDPE